MKEFFKNTIAKVYYNEQLDTLFLEYLDKVPNEQDFIEINSAVLEAFLTLNTNKFVADIRKMGIISINSQQWVLEKLLPGMIKHLGNAKLHHCQLLDPDEIFSKVSAANIKSKSVTIMDGFDVLQFTDEESLAEYLRSIPS